MTLMPGGIARIESISESGERVYNSEDDGVALVLKSGREIRLSFADLADRKRTREQIHEQIGHWIPEYDDEQHAEIVQAIFRVCGYVERKVES